MVNPNFYDRNYYQAMRGHGDGAANNHNALYQKFITLFNDKWDYSDKVILDAGCGRGDLLLALWNSDARNLWGIDFSDDAIDLTRQQMAQYYPLDCTNRIRKGSLDDVTVFEHSFFDLIVMTDVVEHLPEDKFVHCMNNIKTWLKPGGLLFIHTFPTLGPHKIYQAYLKIMGKKEAFKRNQTAHCNVQTRQTLRKSLSAAGLRVDNLWIANDFSLTSTAYQNMHDSLLKRTARFLIEELLVSAPVSRLFNTIGLGEFANPSIYVCCTSPSSNGDEIQYS